MGMAQEGDEFDLGDVIFLEKFKESEYNATFKVLFHETTCVLKAYHGREIDPDSDPDQEWDLFIRESSAYRRLKEKGFCERGVIPDFYGIIKNLERSTRPELIMFHDDEYPTNAILIEYVPNMHQIDLSNFSPRYLQELREILEDMHSAGVLHGDTYPRNMMIAESPESPNMDQARVLWIDFDSSQMLSEPLSEDQERWVEGENRVVDHFIQALTQDNEQGELFHAWRRYYEGFPPGWTSAIQREASDRYRKWMDEHPEVDHWATPGGHQMFMYV